MASVGICRAICLVVKPDVMHLLRSVQTAGERDPAPLAHSQQVMPPSGRLPMLICEIRAPVRAGRARIGAPAGHWPAHLGPPALAGAVRGAIGGAPFLQPVFGNVGAGGNYPIATPGGKRRSLVMEIVLTAGRAGGRRGR